MIYAMILKKKFQSVISMCTLRIYGWIFDILTRSQKLQNECDYIIFP